MFVGNLFFAKKEAPLFYYTILKYIGSVSFVIHQLHNLLGRDIYLSFFLPACYRWTFVIDRVFRRVKRSCARASSALLGRFAFRNLDVTSSKTYSSCRTIRWEAGRKKKRERERDRKCCLHARENRIAKVVSTGTLLQPDSH